MLSQSIWSSAAEGLLDFRLFAPRPRPALPRPRLLPTLEDRFTRGGEAPGISMLMLDALPCFNFCSALILAASSSASISLARRRAFSTSRWASSSLRWASSSVSSDSINASWDGAFVGGVWRCWSFFGRPRPFFDGALLPVELILSLEP